MRKLLIGLAIGGLLALTTGVVFAASANTTSSDGGGWRMRSVGTLSPDQLDGLDSADLGARLTDPPLLTLEERRALEGPFPLASPS